MEWVRWSEESSDELSAGISRQAVHLEQLTVAVFRLGKGVIVPEHSHPNEQVATMIEGRMLFTVDGHQQIAEPGDSLVFRANVPHAAEALEDTVILDVFAPRREDWLAGDDAYLRGTTAPPS
jgi:quercetin dioxygenase-like cupin family protein